MNLIDLTEKRQVLRRKAANNVDESVEGKCHVSKANRHIPKGIPKQKYRVFPQQRHSPTNEKTKS